MKTYTGTELRALSRENYRKNGLVSYFIMLFAVVLACGFTAINLVLPYFYYFLVPFIIIPLFFAAQAAIILLRDAERLTLGGFFRCFFGYFSEHFRSTFRVLKSLLFSLIFYGAIFITSSIVCLIAFYNTNYCFFGDFVKAIDLFNINSVEQIDAILTQYKSAINMFEVCTLYPAMSVFSFVFIYFCSKNSVSMFYRLKNYNVTGKFIGYIHSNVMKTHKREYLRYYWTLNWPFIILLVSGFALGSYVGYIYELTAYSLYTFGMIAALFLAYVIYGPTYLANKEAIATAFEDEYKEEGEKLAKTMSMTLEELLKKMSEQQDAKNNEDDNEE